METHTQTSARMREVLCAIESYATTQTLEVPKNVPKSRMLQLFFPSNYQPMKRSIVGIETSSVHPKLRKR